MPGRSHVADLIRYITGSEIETISGAVLSVVEKGRSNVGRHKLYSPDFAQATLELKNGIPVRFVTSRIDTGELDTLEISIWCTGGRVSFNLADDRYSAAVLPSRKITVPEGLFEFQTGKPRGNPIQLEELES